MVGMERTPSGAISRSKSNIAKRVEKERAVARAEAQRKARIGLNLQERTQATRARVHGLTASQAASHHASTIEGRLFLKGIITSLEILAIEHYKRTLARFGRDAGVQTMSANPLAKYLPSESRAVAAPATGAALSLSRRHYDAVEDALQRAGRIEATPVAWAVSRICRHGEELPARCMPAFIAGVRALVAHFKLGPDPDRENHALAA